MFWFTESLGQKVPFAFSQPVWGGEGGAHPRWGRRPGGERDPVPPPQLPADPSRAVSGAGRPSAGREFWASGRGVGWGDGGMGWVVAGGFFSSVRWRGEARMSAKRSQMWPGQHCGWQRLGRRSGAGHPAGSGEAECLPRLQWEGSSGPRWACGRSYGVWASGLGVGAASLWKPGLWEPGAGWGATGEKGVGVARGRGGHPPPPALTERGLVAWLGLHDPLVERRGRGKRRKRRSAGEALLRESFAWDLESLFLSPDCGVWVRGNRWKLYFVPKCQWAAAKERMSLFIFIFVSSAHSVPWKRSWRDKSCGVRLLSPPSVDSSLLILFPFSGPPFRSSWCKLLSQIQTREMFSSCFLKGVRLLSSFSKQPGSVWAAATSHMVPVTKARFLGTLLLAPAPNS